MEFNTSREITLRDYLRVIFRHKIVFIILPLAVIIPAYMSFEMKTPTYEASVRMYVKGQKGTEVDYYFGILSHSITEDHTKLITTNIVLERVVEVLKLYQIPLDYEMKFTTRLRAKLLERGVKEQQKMLMEMTEEKRQAFLFQRAVNMLRGKVSALPERGGNFFTINARDFNPALAKLIANSVSRSYVIFDLEQQIAELQLEYGEKHSTIVKLEDYIEEFKKTLDGRPLPDLEAIGPASVKIVKQAEAGMLSSEGLNKQLMLILSFLTSIVLGVILSFLLDYYDQTFKTPGDIEKFLKIQFLGSVPMRKSGKKLLSDLNPETSNYTRSYQYLSEQLSLLMKDRGMKTLLITESEGMKDLFMVAANIGINLSHKSGYRVLIIDADLRQSGVSRVFRISNNTGLAGILEKKASFMDTVQDLGNDLHVLPSGETHLNPATLLGFSAMSDVINKATGEYDFVFVVCPDLMTYTDAIVVSAFTDGTVLIINEGKTRRQVVENSVNPMRQKKINIIGAILNNHRYVIPEIIYKLT